MKKFLSDRIQNLSESETIAMSRMSRELQSEGRDIISLSLGEPDFNTPDFIKDAAIKAIDDNYSTYMPVPGYLDLRESISAKFKRDNNLDYSASQIVVSTGAKQSLAMAILSLVNHGDEVIIPAPYWVTYKEIVKLAEGIPVIISSDISQDYKVSAEQIEAHITDKTKLLIYSSPCNPSGSVFSRGELEKIAKVIKKHPQIVIISDEIYEHILFEGKHESIASFDFICNQVVTVNGVSKGFAMTGWRLGYLGAPQWIADACVKMQGQFTSGTCSIAQRAAKAAVEADPSVTKDMKAAFLNRRNLMINGLNEIKGIKCNVPKGAFYLFPDISDFFGKETPERTVISNSNDLCMYLLNSAEVSLVCGDAFGAPNCLRISYATSEDKLITALKRMNKALSQLT